MADVMNSIVLKSGHDKRVRAGHPWVFSNEVEGCLKDHTPGAIVEVVDHRGRFLGRGYFNPHSLISVRLLTRQIEEIDEGFFLRRISRAWSYRQRIYPGQISLRAVYSEADGLPGLIVDRYEDCLAVQVLTLGMEVRQDLILGVLEELFRPRAIILRNDSPVRKLEGLALEKKVTQGNLEGPVNIEEGGLRLRVDLIEGQKTGFFFDQRENRLRLKRYVSGGGRLLDAFCYTGAWALHGLLGGASAAVCIDASARALSLAQENAVLNGMETRCCFLKADLFQELPRMVEVGERFEVVILDPPSLVEGRKALAVGVKGYEKINHYALQLVQPGGFLATSCCSYHLSREEFSETVQRAARKAGRFIRMVEWGQQALDHPALPAVPETAYLKCLFLEVE